MNTFGADDPATFWTRVQEKYPVPAAAPPTQGPDMPVTTLREPLHFPDVETSEELERIIASAPRVMVLVYHAFDRRVQWLRDWEEACVRKGVRVWAAEQSVVPSLVRKHNIRLLPALLGFERGQLAWQKPLSASAVLETTYSLGDQ